MQHTTELDVMNLSQRYIVINTGKGLTTAICKSAPLIAFEKWMEQGRLVTRWRANEYLFGLIFVSAQF